MTHPKVPHPGRRPGHALFTRDNGWLVRVNDRLLDWVTDRVLGSVLMFDLALIAPLAVLPMSDSAKLFLAVISGTWIQWWALHSVTRSARKKADADHQAFTHVALTVDATKATLDDLRAEVAALRTPARPARVTKKPTP